MMAWWALDDGVRRTIIFARMRHLATRSLLLLAVQAHTASAANIQPPIFTTQFPLIFEQLKKEAERDVCTGRFTTENNL